MSKLHVGFHKADITPKTGGIPLAGWGATHLRLAATVADPLYCYVTAFGNSEKAEALYITNDLIGYPNDFIDELRKVIEEKTGIPAGMIIINGTHTHSAPDLRSGLETIKKYRKYLGEVLADTALRAINDMKPAEIYYGTNEVGKPGTRFNFVRHYTMTTVEYKDHPQDGPEYHSGNNFGFQYLAEPDKYVYTGHESEADPEIQLVEFRRENADSILFVNFQSHALLSSGVACTVMTPDFPGALCDKLCLDIPNTQAVYVQGCCGNINPVTRIREEAILGLTFDPFRPNDDTDSDWHAYGAVLAAYVKEIHDFKLKKSESDKFTLIRKVLDFECDHSQDYLLPKAEKVLEKYDKEGNTREVIALAMANGFTSPYHCGSIRGRSRLPKSLSFEINGLRFGDTAIVTSPSEVYDQIGRRIKKESPFKCTLLQCYSCGGRAYLPVKDTWDTSYERNNTLFPVGTAERLGDEWMKLLEELK